VHVVKADAPLSLLPNGKRFLLAGLALAGFEIVRADGVKPFVLFGALVMVVISGAWLQEEFVLPRWRS
jgi:hypothetical protein